MRRMIVALMGLVCGVFAANAASRTLTGDYEISGNCYDTLICNADLTITFTAPQKTESGIKAYWLQAILRVSPGKTVTLDFSACTDGDVYWDNSFVLDDATAKLRIKGTRKINFGGRGAATTLSAFDGADVAFVDADGNAISDLAEDEGIVFAAQATLWTLPNCRYSYAKGAEICLGGVSASEAGIFTPNDDNEIVLADYDLYIIDVKKIDSTATIRVKPGRKLSFKPCTRNPPFNWTGSSDKELKNPIVLESDGESRAKLFHRASKNNFFAGPVTGEGDFEFTSDNYGNPGCIFQGVIDFRGSVFVHGNTASSTTAATPLQCCFNTNFAGHVENPVKLGGSTEIRFKNRNDQSVLYKNVTIKTLTGVDEKGYVGTLYAAIGQTITVGELTGPVKLAGNGTVRFDKVGAGATVFVSPQIKTDFGEIDKTATIVFESTADGQSFETVLGGKAFAVSPADGVRAVSNILVNGTLNLRAEAAKVSVRGSDGLAYRLDSRAGEWTNSVSLWIDPTRNRHEILDYTSTNAASPHVELVHDAREGATYLLQNNYQRTAAGGQGDNWHKANSPYPILKNDYAVDGVTRPYLYCDNFTKNRRLYIGKEGATPYSVQTMPSEFVVMVFGGQQGGGAAVIKGGASGNTVNPFGRCADSETPNIDTPLFTNDVYTTWINGQSVDPTQEKVLSNGWQVISFKTCGKTIAGIGYNVSTYNRAGGQNYGDILVFDRVLTDAERQDVEKKLAEKWGIPYDGAPLDSTEARLAGAGTVTVGADEDVTVKGLFRGTLALEDGAKLTVPEASLPPTAEDVKAISGRVNWFDPDAEGALYLNTTKGREMEIGGVYDRVDGAAEGAFMMYGVNLGNATSSRCPWLNVTARGVGAPTRKWIDMSNGRFGEKDVYGNVLRYRPAPYDHAGNSDTGKNTNRNIRAGFVVYDSSRSAGNPAMDTIDGSGKVKRRSSISDPIWSGQTDAILKNGKQYLNGVAVDGKNDPFGAKPEVFAFTTTANFPLMSMGNYVISQEDRNAGEYFGEAIFFNTVLGDEDRKTVENYLMAKWFGYANGAYTDLREATVTGAGTVKATSAAELPQFAAEFVGAVELANADLAFAYADQAIEGALDFGGGSYAFAKGAKVKVDFASRPKAGDYVLVSAGKLEGVLPQLEKKGAFDGRPMELVIEDNKRLILRLGKVGMQIFVK